MTSFDFDADESTALAIIEPAGTAIAGRIAGTAFEQAEALTSWQRLDLWLLALGENTRRGYEGDLTQFARDTGCLHPDAPREAFQEGYRRALAALCEVRRSSALAVVEGWRDRQIERGTSSATINRRLSAINSALRTLARADYGPGKLDVALVRQEARRDTRGPSAVGISRALDLLAAGTDASAKRDLAIVLLAAQRGLRRSEIAGLTLADLDLAGGAVRAKRKGRREKVVVQIAGEVVSALSMWIQARQDFAQPGVDEVFIGLSNSHFGQPIGGHAIWAIVKRAGAQAGGSPSAWRPHGLRHRAISEALRVSNGSLPAAQTFAGHAQSSTTSRYLDDSAEIEARVVSGMVGVYDLGGEA